MIPPEEIKHALESKGKYWIVFTGDSITSCEWVHPNWRDIVIYAVQNPLTSNPNLKGFNFAYDGATTKDILDKLDEITLVKPDLVISLMGGNDPAFNIPVSEHVSNIEKIVDRLISSGSKVVWSNSTPAATGSPKNAQYEPYVKASMKIPAGKNLQFLDMFNLYQQFPLDRIFTFISEENPMEGIKAGEPDLQHPNQLGNAYIAKVILEKVFGVSFDPEKYISDTLSGQKYPGF